MLPWKAVDSLFISPYQRKVATAPNQKSALTTKTNFVTIYCVIK